MSPRVAPTRRPGARTPSLQLAGAGILWGTGGVVGATLQERTHLTSLSTAGWRLAVAAVLLVGWHVLRSRPLRCERRHLPSVVAVGLLLALFQACYFASVTRLGVAVATLVTLGSAPVLVTAAAAVATRRAPSGRGLVALAVALAGLALVVLGSSSAAGGTGSAAAGLVLAVVSASGFAAVTLLSSRLGPSVEPLTTTTLAMVTGAVVLVPLAAVTGVVVPALGVPDLGLLLYLGLGPTALAYGLYLTGLRTAAPAAGAMAALLEPVTATVLAAVLLGERLGVLGVVGAGGVVLAVALATTDRAGPTGPAPDVPARTMER